MVMGSLLLVTQAFSKEAEQKTLNLPDYGKDVAKSVDVLLKRSKNMEGFLKNLEGQYSTKEVRDAKKLLLKRGYSQKDKIPSFKRVGSRIVFDSQNFVDFVGPSLLVANGIKVRSSKEKLDQKILNVLDQLEKKDSSSTSFLHNLFFPKAHAFGTLTGIIAAVAGGAAGSWAGPEYLGTSRVMGGALGVGAVYLVTELFQSSKDGEVSCTPNGNYQVRNKERNGIFMASAEFSRVTSSTLAAARLPNTCTENRAAQLQRALETGNIDRNAASPTNENSAGSSSIQ